jgi:hypothetical protein
MLRDKRCNPALALMLWRVHVFREAVRTLLIALLFGFPVVGNADGPLVSNWLWQPLPAPPAPPSLAPLSHESFTRLVALSRGRDPAPPRKTNGIEAAEAVNALRMQRYREHCELLKHGELHGVPGLYPSQIPLLETR